MLKSPREGPAPRPYFAYKIFGAVPYNQGSFLKPYHPPLPFPIDLPRIVAQKCVHAFEGATWAATYPSKLEFSALARSMTSPAYSSAKNRFEIFGGGSHRPGG